MTHVGRHFALLLILCSLCPLSAVSQVANQGFRFWYKGYLETAGGDPVNGIFTLAFTIHSDPQEDQAIWGEEHRDFQIVDGSVDIQLGSINAIDDVMLQTVDELFLGVSIDNNAEMRPRLKVRAVLRAQWASYAAHAKDVRGEVINPASIQINGAEVIDANGNWSGSTNYLRNDRSGTVNGAVTVNRLETAQGVVVNGHSVVNGLGTVKPGLTGGIHMGAVNGAGSFIKYTNCGPGTPNNCSNLQLKVGDNAGNDRVSVYSRYGIQLNGPGDSDIGLHWPADRWGRDGANVGNDAYIRFAGDAPANSQLQIVVKGNQDDDILIRAPGGITLDGNVNVTGTFDGPGLVTAAQIRERLITVDGAGSNIDADLLDGLSSALFVRSDQDGAINGVLTVSQLDSAQGLSVNGGAVIDAVGNWLGPPTMTDGQVLNALVNVDGVGSGVDADRLDGLSSDVFVRNDGDGSVNGVLAVNRLDSAQGIRVNGVDLVDAGGNWVGGAPMTAVEIRTLLLGVDGQGSGVDADLLDGLSSAVFVRNDGDSSVDGVFTVNRLDSAQGIRVNGAEVVDADGNWVGADPLTAAEIRTLLLTVDGAGSGISADDVDGISSEVLVRNDGDGTINGVLAANRLDSAQGLHVNGVEVVDAGGNWVGADPLTALEIRTLLLTVDGAGSQISADDIDGISGELLVRNDGDSAINGILAVNSLDSSQGVRVNGADVIDAAGNWVGVDPMTALEIRTLLLTVDGVGSGLSADDVDGVSSELFLRNDADGQLAGTLATDALVVSNDVAVGHANPATALDVNGAVKVGTQVACGAAHAGAIRFDDGSLEVCDGNEWQAILTAGGDNQAGCTLEPLEVDGVNVAHARVLTCRDQDPIRVQVMDCGNNVVDVGEGCDDGNFVADDGCNDRCQLECGDGVVGANEQCDDGNRIDTDGCTNSCVDATCGDGIIQDGVETCDGGDDCLPDCTKPDCADTGGCPGLDFVPIAGAIYTMGYADGASNEQPTHQVTVADFEILRHEVTVAQYRACVNAGVCTAANDEDGWGRSRNDDHPVRGVSWLQARTFAQWVGADLPTEAQWEFAATSRGNDQRYPWGNEAPDCDRAHHYGCHPPLTSTICTHPTGHTAEGVCDMAGNVWEWVLDNYHATYDGAPADGSAWCDAVDCADDGQPRVWKGGDYLSDVTKLRASARGNYGADAQQPWMGFRLAR